MLDDVINAINYYGTAEAARMCRQHISYISRVKNRRLIPKPYTLHKMAYNMELLTKADKNNFENEQAERIHKMKVKAQKLMAKAKKENA